MNATKDLTDMPQSVRQVGFLKNINYNIYNN